MSRSRGFQQVGHVVYLLPPFFSPPGYPKHRRTMPNISYNIHIYTPCQRPVARNVVLCCLTSLPAKKRRKKKRVASREEEEEEEEDRKEGRSFWFLIYQKPPCSKPKISVVQSTKLPWLFTPKRAIFSILLLRSFVSLAGFPLFKVIKELRRERRIEKGKKGSKTYAEAKFWFHWLWLCAN